jgi:putative transposase
MRPFFTADSVKAAYQVRFHFGWYVHSRQQKLQTIKHIVEDTLKAVCEKRSYHLLEYEVEPSVLRALISLTPTTSPAEVTRFIKGNIATAARNEVGISDLWSRGWFCRSLGTVTTETIRSYVDGQYAHHRAAPESQPDLAAKAQYRHPGDGTVLRTSSHAVFEYNLHVVLVTSRRQQAIDLEIADAIAVYLRQVCEKKQWVPWNIDVLPDHLHVLMGVAPSDAPEDVALSVLNNLEFFVQNRHGAALREVVESTCFQPGCFVGTVGAATTAQVKAFLARAGSGGEVER